MSDHELIGTVRKSNCRKFSPRRIQCRSFKNIDTIKFRNDIRDTLGNPLCIEFLKSNDLNTAWSKFKSLITAVVDKHAPLMERSVRGRDCPWLTSEIKQKIGERDYYLRKARRSSTENDWSTFRRLRNSVTSAIRNSKANYNRTILRENMNSPKNFWKTIKKCYPSNSKQLNPTKSFNFDGGKVSDAMAIANGFCSYFSIIASCLHQSLVILSDPVWRVCFDLSLRSFINPDNKVFTFHQIDWQEALYELRNISPSKETGFDNLPAVLIN